MGRMGLADGGPIGGSFLAAGSNDWRSPPACCISPNCCCSTSRRRVDALARRQFWDLITICGRRADLLVSTTTWTSGALQAHRLSRQRHIVVRKRRRGFPPVGPHHFRGDRRGIDERRALCGRRTASRRRPYSGARCMCGNDRNALTRHHSIGATLNGRRSSRVSKMCSSTC